MCPVPVRRFFGLILIVCVMFIVSFVIGWTAVVLASRHAEAEATVAADKVTRTAGQAALHMTDMAAQTANHIVDTAAKAAAAVVETARHVKAQ